MTELRAALSEVYTTVGRDAPTYGSGAITARQTAVTVQQIAELRTLVLAIW